MYQVWVTNTLGEVQVNNVVLREEARMLFELARFCCYGTDNKAEWLDLETGEVIDNY